MHFPKKTFTFKQVTFSTASLNSVLFISFLLKTWFDHKWTILGSASMYRHGIPSRRRRWRNSWEQDSCACALIHGPACHVRSVSWLNYLRRQFAMYHCTLFNLVHALLFCIVYSCTSFLLLFSLRIFVIFCLYGTHDLILKLLPPTWLLLFT